MSAFDALTYMLTTGSKQSGTQRHYRHHHDGRGVSIQRTAKRGKRGIIVSLKSVYGGDYTTALGFRSAEIARDGDGWVAVETGWGHHTGHGEDHHNDWIVNKSGVHRLMADAENEFIEAVLDGKPLANVVSREAK